MKKTISLGSRMKDYEKVSKSYLPKRMPVIIRIDGKAFHTYTKGFDKPYDNNLVDLMGEVTSLLVSNIMGCKFGYTQSDEISLLLTNDTNLNTEAWFNNNVQKIASVASSMATAYFNMLLPKYIDKGLKAPVGTPALFDARVSVLPHKEVANYFIWRQEDATKNSIQMLAQSIYTQKELNGIKTKDLINKMVAEYSINWLEIPKKLQRGIAVYRYVEETLETIKTTIVIDEDMPLVKEDRDFVEHLLNFNTDTQT